MISAQGSAWTIEAAGDRDPAGAPRRDPSGLDRARSGGAAAGDRRMAAVRIRAASGHDHRRTPIGRSDDDPPAQRARRAVSAAHRSGRALLARGHFLALSSHHETTNTRNTRNCVSCFRLSCVSCKVGFRRAVNRRRDTGIYPASAACVQFQINRLRLALVHADARRPRADTFEELWSGHKPGSSLSIAMTQ